MIFTESEASWHPGAAAQVERILGRGFGDDYTRLLLQAAHSIQNVTGDSSVPAVVSVAGSQGSGKTTFCRNLGRLLEAMHDRQVVTVSLDDFYLTRGERQRLASQVHPLLETRGVPGTHDLARLTDALAELRRGRETSVPRFDKSTDDRHGQPRVVGPAEVILCEGWCWGAVPEPADRLIEPVNTLEREQDPDGSWRRFVNERLLDYQPVFQADGDIFFAAPSLEAVRRWRWQQEQQLVGTSGGDRVMNEKQVAGFIAYYERLTLWMLEERPGKAALTVKLLESHAIGRVLGK